MKLPNADRAVIEREKIVGYLLNAAHPFGASKASFLAAFGFRVEAWEALADALQDHGRRHDVSKMSQTGFGPRYEVDGALQTPDGRNPRMRTVWQIDEGQVVPRLITAHPLEVLE